MTDASDHRPQDVTGGWAPVRRTALRLAAVVTALATSLAAPLPASAGPAPAVSASDASAPTASTDRAPARRLTLDPLPGRALSGSLVRFSGTLTRSPDGSPVVIQRRVGDVWKSFRRTSTRATGAYETRLRVGSRGTQAFRALAPRTGGRPAVASRSRQLDVAVVPVAVVRVRSQYPTTTADLVFNGSVEPFVAGTRLQLQRRRGDTWVPVDEGAATVDDRGGFRLVVPRGRDTDRYRVRVARGGPFLTAAASNVVVGLDLPVQPPEIVTRTLPEGTVDAAYRVPLRIEGGRPGTWSIDSGALPDGLALEGDSIVGTPTTAGTATFTVEFDDGDNVDSRELQIRVRTAAERRWVSVATGYDHSCGVRESGSLECWGSGRTFGVPQFAVRRPVRIGAADDWARVEAGYLHTCALSDADALSCWGFNGAGQLGLGDRARRREPALVDARPWSTVAPGRVHTCGITGGELYCWGGNASGQLGVGDRERRFAPTRVGDSDGWTDVTTGETHTCGIDDGRLLCWGSGGQLGLGDDDARTTPTRVGVRDDWTTVVSGDVAYHTCGVAGGQLWCWGYNVDGQLGLGDTDDRAVPTRVGTADDWDSLTAGRGSTCGTRADGALRCWGLNQWGQLGVGDFTRRTRPTVVADVDGPDDPGRDAWTTFDAGNIHTCGIVDAAPYCWGNGSDGATAQPGRNQVVPTPVDPVDVGARGAGAS